MGLDMYAYSVGSDSGNTDFEIASTDVNRDFAYWRKFNALHGWMRDLAYTKGFSGDFNCVPVRLTESDLLQLIADVNDGKLKPTEGFFFGHQEYYEEDVEAVREFVDKAIREIRVSDREVYYDSWW